MQQRRLDVVTFGETMLRLSAPGSSRLEEAISLDVRIGGSESNTAVAMARLGLRVAWWTKLPDNPLGRRIENEIRRWGVDTTQVVWDQSPASRAGLYFVEFGVPPRGIDVTYDRARSAASAIGPADVPEQAIREARLLHLTGITPALSPACAEAMQHAINIARSAGTLISFDVNYRAKLWSPEQARAGLEPLMQGVDLLRSSRADAVLLFGIDAPADETAREMRRRYGVRAAVVTDGASDAVASEETGERRCTPHALEQVVDRVGRGDAFNAGVLYGLLAGDLALGLDYGVAMAALKLTMPGDLLIASKSEIDAVRARTGGGIRR
jgi:2-dehydro-3-deoxygluconokinase